MTLRRNLTWAAVAALAAGWWLWRPAPPPAAPEAVLPQAATRGVGFDFALPGNAPAPAATARCEQVALDWREGKATQRQCLTAATARQNGSLRSHVLGPAGEGAHWTLRVDVLGDAVHAVSLLDGSRAAWACRAEGCAGITLGAHDGKGRREIVLAGTQLAALLPDGKPAQPQRAITIDTRFRTVADSAIPGLACAPDDSLSVNTSRGGLIDFCARGGAGIELGDHGERSFSFASLDGGTLVATLDAGGRLAAIDYRSGATHYGCRAGLCGGASLAAPDAGRPGALRFLGTQLVEQRDDGMTGTTTVALNGALKLPEFE